MSLKPKPQKTESDHIRDTLTDLVKSVGEANSSIKKLDSKVDKRFDEHDKRFDEHDKRFDKIEDTLAIIVNHLRK